jgi:hypothetical protein
VQLHRSWGHDLLYFLFHFSQGYRLPAHIWGQGVAPSCLAIVWPRAASFLEAGLSSQLTAECWSLMIQTHSAPRHDCCLWHWQFSETIKPWIGKGFGCSTLSTILLTKVKIQSLQGITKGWRMDILIELWKSEKCFTSDIYNAHLKSNVST